MFSYQEKYDIRFKFISSSKRNRQHDNRAILLYAREYNIILIYCIHNVSWNGKKKYWCQE